MMIQQTTNGCHASMLLAGIHLPNVWMP
ncbi:MAG: hypothetical protein ACD_45C00399G0001, partial [uncultured bacterium]